VEPLTVRSNKFGIPVPQRALRISTLTLSHTALVVTIRNGHHDSEFDIGHNMSFLHSRRDRSIIESGQLNGLLFKSESASYHPFIAEAPLLLIMAVKRKEFYRVLLCDGEAPVGKTDGRSIVGEVFSLSLF
jgi:hypothetical protein